jgi:phosphonate transport system substrate-binding protein
MARGAWALLARGAMALLLGCPLVAAAQAGGGSSTVGAGTLRFGILPLGGAFESRNDWEPLLADMSRAIGRPVTMLSVTSYEALEQAIQRDQVDMAFLSGKWWRKSPATTACLATAPCCWRARRGRTAH